MVSKGMRTGAIWAACCLIAFMLTLAMVPGRWWNRAPQYSASANGSTPNDGSQNAADRATKRLLAPPAPPLGSATQELADWIRPRNGEERWLEIGWFTDLVEAQQVASKTNRLIFLWGTNDPPGRC